MNVIMDFLSNRSFKVKYNEATSGRHDLFVRCVQGCILGPKLFGIYCNQVINVLHQSKISTYADDSYVITTAKNMEELKTKKESTMSQHIKFLKAIGMVVKTQQRQNYCMHQEKIDSNW